MSAKPDRPKAGTYTSQLICVRLHLSHQSLELIKLQNIKKKNEKIEETRGLFEMI